MDLPFATGYYIDESRQVSIECANVVPEFYTVAGVQFKKLRAPAGISLFATAGTNATRGPWVMDEIAYEVAGTLLWRINEDGTTTNLGTIVGTGRVSMVDNGTQLCIVVPGSTGYIYSVAGGLVTITDVDYTANPSLQVAFADGYFHHVTESKYFISALNDGTSYNALDFAAAEILPDKIVGIHVNRNQVYIAGVETVEPFSNIGGAGFPYQRVNGGVIPVGVKAKFSMVEYGHSVAFVGGAKNETPSVYLFSGQAPARIANNAIDLIIEGMTDAERAAIYCTTYSERGGFFLNVHFNNRTMAFDTSTELWTERKSKDSEGRQTNWRVSGIISAYGKILVLDNQSGNVGEMSKDVYDEYGVSVKRVFDTIPLGAQGRRLTFSEMEIIMENGTGLGIECTGINIVGQAIVGCAVVG